MATVTSCLLIFGAEEGQIQKLLRFVRGTDADGMPLVLDFDRARPVPAELVAHLTSVAAKGTDLWWRGGQVSSKEMRLVRGPNGNASIGIECSDAPPITIVASLARLFPRVGLRLLWSEPRSAGSGVVSFDRDGFFRETWVPAEANAEWLLRGAGWDERTFPLSYVLPDESWFRFGRYDLALEDIINEFQYGYPIDSLGDIDEACETLMQFTRNDVAELLERATRDLDLIDDDNGITETILLCRAAVDMLEERLGPQ